MRVLFAIALLSVGFTARAADLPIGGSGGDFVQRAEMVWLYDDQPGVVVRAYWSEPWNNQHYFPFTGVRPHIGRRENLSAPSHPSKPAQSYSRTWNNNWAFEHSPVILPEPGNQTGIFNQDGGHHDSDVHHHPHPRVHHHTPMH